MDTETKATLWRGAEELRPMLMPVETLNPAPFNIRQGDIPVIADSLRRFGQLKPIVLDDEGTILAGNNVYRAAIELLGWSHLAAVTADRMSEDDRLLFMVADNHASDSARLNPEASKQVHTYLLLQAETADDEYAALFRGAADAIAKAASRADSPGHAAVVDIDGLPIEFCCTSCGYEWSGGQSSDA